jgi:hypothetical protein
MVCVHTSTFAQGADGAGWDAYGFSVCDRIGAQRPYAQLVEEVKRDFGTADYYQGGYLINQAVNELCPAQISQLRESAAGYTLPA